MLGFRASSHIEGVLKSLRKAICLLPAACCLFLLFSCGSNPLDIDVSKEQVPPVKIQRFDRDFFALNTGDINQKVPELQKKYPGFTEMFVRNLLCPKGIRDSSCLPEITRFVNDKDMRGAYDASQKIFTDMSTAEGQITDIFRHYKHYFPGTALPHIYAVIAGFNYSIASGDSLFAIGLEMYLGEKSPYYDMIRIPGYKHRVMNRAYIASDFLRVWMLDEFPNKNKSGTLLNEMIYQGKLLYLADAMMPEQDDTLKIGFTQKQLDWCLNHENDMWGFLVKNKLLYSTEVTDVAKYTGEGPFTTGFVKESPARTGVWIGWRIVRQYMKENPKVTLEELMKENEAQIILAKSKYKP